MRAFSSAAVAWCAVNTAQRYLVPALAVHAVPEAVEAGVHVRRGEVIRARHAGLATGVDGAPALARDADDRPLVARVEREPRAAARTGGHRALREQLVAGAVRRIVAVPGRVAGVLGVAEVAGRRAPEAARR